MCDECKLREELKRAGVPDLVDIHELGDYLNLSSRRIQQLAREGIIPMVNRGKYDLIKCIQNYIIYLKDQVIAKHVERRY